MEQLIHIIKASNKSGGNILELGCGNGKLINAVAELTPPRSV